MQVSIADRRSLCLLSLLQSQRGQTQLYMLRSQSEDWGWSEIRQAQQTVRWSWDSLLLLLVCDHRPLALATVAGPMADPPMDGIIPVPLTTSAPLGAVTTQKLVNGPSWHCASGPLLPVTVYVQPQLNTSAPSSTPSSR